MRKEGDTAFPQQVVERLDAASRRAGSVREDDVDGVGRKLAKQPSPWLTGLPKNNDLPDWVSEMVSETK